jgi:hypothetical protein
LKAEVDAGYINLSMKLNAEAIRNLDSRKQLNVIYSVATPYSQEGGINIQYDYGDYCFRV